MRFPIKTLLICGLTLASKPVYSCETVATARLDSQCVVMSVGPSRGVWFRDDAWATLHAAWLELPQVRERASAAETLATVEETQSKLYRAAYITESDALEHQKAATDLTQSELDKANAALVKATAPDPFLLRLLRVGAGTAVAAGLGALAGQLTGESAVKGAAWGGSAGLVGAVTIEVIK